MRYLARTLSEKVFILVDEINLHEVGELIEVGPKKVMAEIVQVGIQVATMSTFKMIDGQVRGLVIDDEYPEPHMEDKNPCDADK